MEGGSQNQYRYEMSQISWYNIKTDGGIKDKMDG